MRGKTPIALPLITAVSGALLAILDALPGNGGEVSMFGIAAGAGICGLGLYWLAVTLDRAARPSP